MRDERGNSMVDELLDERTGGGLWEAQKVGEVGPGARQLTPLGGLPEEAHQVNPDPLGGLGAGVEFGILAPVARVEGERGDLVDALSHLRSVSSLHRERGPGRTSAATRRTWGERHRLRSEGDSAVRYRLESDPQGHQVGRGAGLLPRCAQWWCD